MNVPELHDVEEIAVVGAGTMGHGIAQVFATADYEVTLIDIDEDILESALEKIEESLQETGGSNPEEVLDRLSTTTDRSAGLAEIDLMIEAVPENMEFKRDVFADADEAAPDRAILATNTSTLPITEIAENTDRPNKVVGMHFSNPVQVMPIVEVISGTETDKEVFDLTAEIAKAIGKTPVHVEKDVPGFLLNRINLRFWTEALRQIDVNEYDPKTIDASIRRLGFPMGPFEVLDYSGVDVVEMSTDEVRSRGVSIYQSEALQKLTEEESYGVKSGKGFYDYPSPGEYERPSIPRESRYEFNPIYLMAPAVNEAAWLLENDVTSKADIDKAVRIGVSWPRGLLEFADEYGIDRIVDTLNELHEETGREEYEPHPLLLEMVDEEHLGLKTGKGFYEHEYEKETLGPVEYERREFYAVITLNRPKKLNALNRDSWEGLDKALTRAANDDEVRATLLRGAGGAFSAGDDIAEMQSWESAEEGEEFFQNVALPAIEAVRTHPKPTIAVVDGIATGAGGEIVLLSDLAVATQESRLGQPEAAIGALPPIWLMYGATSVGKKKLLEVAMTCDLVSASEAEDMGWVNYAVSRNQAMDVAREIARSTTESAPQSVEAIKSIWSGFEADLQGSWMDDSVSELVELLQTQQGREGLSAFLANENPPWSK